MTDTADHKETITKNVAVTAAPILVTAVPESGELVPGLENRIYVVSTYADSTPARCEVVWANPRDRKPQTIQTDEAGFGQFTYRPDQPGNLPMILLARDEKGQKAGPPSRSTPRPRPATTRSCCGPTGRSIASASGRSWKSSPRGKRAPSTWTSSRTARPIRRAPSSPRGPGSRQRHFRPHAGRHRADQRLSDRRKRRDDAGPAAGDRRSRPTT